MHYSSAQSAKQTMSKVTLDMLRAMGSNPSRQSIKANTQPNEQQENQLKRTHKAVSSLNPVFKFRLSY